MKKEITLIAISYSVPRLEPGMLLKELRENKIQKFTQADYDDREIYHQYRSLWNPIKLYGVYDAPVKEGDKFLSGEVGNYELALKVFTFCGNYKNDLVKIKDEKGNMLTSTKFLMEGIRKVIICPDQIGLKRCWSSSILEDNGWEEAIDSDDIQEILSNGGKCWIEMENEFDYKKAKDPLYNGGAEKVTLLGGLAFISLTE